MTVTFRATEDNRRLLSLLQANGGHFVARHMTPPQGLNASQGLMPSKGLICHDWSLQERNFSVVRVHNYHPEPA